MNLIVAADAAWGIGKDGEQMVYIAPDLKRFRRLTSGHPILVGRKTLATFPGGRPLKNRRNLILSRDPSFTVEGFYGIHIQVLTRHSHNFSSHNNKSSP